MNRIGIWTGTMRRDTANGDFQMKFSYRDTSGVPGPEAQIRYRYADANNLGLLRLFPTSVRVTEMRAGTPVDLAAGSWATTPGAWYDVTLIADGTHMELWRGPKGGAQSRVCSVDNATLMSGTKSYILVAAGGTYAFDDFQMSAEDLLGTEYTYDAANQLTAMNAGGTVTNFTYDDWGRNTGKTQGTASATYTYSCGDKLATAVSYLPGEALVGTWDYDGLGKRRSEVSWFSGQPSQTVRFRWSGWEESGEYAAGTGGQYIGAKQTGYVPGLAAYAGSDPSTADWRFNLNDQLGSPRQMLGQDKSSKARFDFSPYGELMRSAGLPLTVGYTGHRWDPAIGQYFAPFRYYSPQTARWNMRDPLGLAAGLNVYGYVGGNPITGIDPLGLIKECEENNTKTHLQNKGLPERHNPGDTDDRFPNWPQVKDGDKDRDPKAIAEEMDKLLGRDHTVDPKDPTRFIWPWGTDKVKGRIVLEQHPGQGGQHEGPHWHYRWNPPGSPEGEYGPQRNARVKKFL